MKQIKRVLALLTCGAMLVGNIPVTAFAEDLSQQGLCEHHPEHVECAYSSVETVSACTHQHEDDCYAVAEDCTHIHDGCGTDEVPCDHQCGVESGCVTESLACQHQHDSECGYGVTTDITPCDFVCSECVKKAEDQTAADEVAALIAALPVLDDIKDKVPADQQEDYNQVQTAYDAYCDLTTEQQDLLPMAEEVFKSYFEYFNSMTHETNAVANGTCGENLTWVLTDEGTLTISGEGAMLDYERKGAPWWWDHHDQIECIIIEEGITHIGAYTFHNFGALHTVNIPSTVCSIGAHAFEICTKLNKVFITDLSAWCNIQFANNPLCQINGVDMYLDGELLTDCIIPDDVTTLPYGVFMYCNSLTKVTIPGSITSVDSETFYMCKNLTDVILLDGIQTVGSYMFSGCSNLVNVRLPGSVKAIEYGAFYNCASMVSINLPTSITSIGDSAFHGCTKLANINIPNGVTSIGYSTFQGCQNLSTIHIPDAVTSIGYQAFALSGITSISIPNTITSIENHTFSACRNLTSITIPENVISIGLAAFECCDNLAEIIFVGDAPLFWINPEYPEWGNDAFNGINTTAYYPDNNPTWTDTVKQNYGGTITWVPYTTEHTHEYGDDHKCECGAIGGTCGENLIWTFDQDTGVLTIDGTGAMTNYTSELAPWYSYRESIVSVAFPNGITTIGDGAFNGCSNLKSITIPNGVNYIGSMAFAACRNMTSITIPESVTTIRGGAFFWCESLESIILPSKITAIANTLFYTCSSLTHVTIPDGVTSIGNESFSQCANLSSVTIPGSVTFIDEGAFMSCSKLTSITIPDAVTAIGPAAFAGCSGIKTITIPGKVDEIGCGAFMNCTGLQSITFEGDAPDFLLETADGEYMEESNTFHKVTATAYYPANNPTWTSAVMKQYYGTITWVPYSNEIIASGNCNENLTWTLDGAGTLTISGNGSMGVFHNLADMPWYSYREQIKNVYIGSDVNSINITSISIASILNGIWVNPNNSNYSSDVNGILYNKNKTELIRAPRELSGKYTISNSVKTIGNSAFLECSNLEGITIPDSVTYIGDGVFYGCSSLTSVVIPDHITRISIQMFYGCESLASLTIPSRVTKINQGAFHGCSSLTSITIPARVSSIDSGAFNNCTSLTGIWVDENNSNYSNDANGVLFNNDKTILIQAPTGISGCYTIPESVMRIEDFAFNGCKNLKDIIIPDSVNELGMHAFSGCSKLTSIAIPDGVTYLDWGIFASCTNLSSVTLPANLTAIGDYAFQYCSSLTSIELPDTLTQIGYAAFLECTSLTSITLPKSITYIGDFAFGRCSSLGEIIFAGNAPEFQIDHGPEVTESQAFSRITANAYYPINNSTWTADVMKNYYGTITWVPYGAVENRLILDSEALDGYDSVWIDGVEMIIQKDDDSWYIDLPDSNAHVMTTYAYQTDGAAEDGVDTHAVYPISMQVWTLENQNGVYTVTRQDNFNDILQYSGVAIRVTGKQGIRMITSIDEANKDALTGNGLAGYTLKEYGTAIAWASQLGSTKPLTLGKSYVSSNYAYKKDVADPIFRYADGRIQYTNVLVGFNLVQCKDDIAMRPYMILADVEGNELTIYGGIVERSIGYIALRNRKTFTENTDPYDYVWEIIHAVYGDAYDADWKPTWSDTIM